MRKGWMIRAGESGRLFDDFNDNSYAAIGWSDIGPLTKLSSADDLRAAYIHQFGNAKPSKTNNAIAMIRKFRDEITSGDMVVTYSPETRQYLIGKDEGQYRYEQCADDVYANRRKVAWSGLVSRDSLSVKTRNSLGSTLTLFSLSEEVMAELERALSGEASPAQKETIIEPEFEDIREDAVNRSHELIKDKLQALDDAEMEQMIAAVLRAMGYKTRLSPKGPDRGVDVMASPDGLGLTTPRIKVEVKHRTGTISAPSIRSFVGALREGDSGLYLSTGGFSKEARYEADRANVPVTLINLDDLADLIVNYYDNFDAEGRVLLPLVRVYWPAE